MDFPSLEFARNTAAVPPQPVDATPTPRPIPAEYSTDQRRPPASRPDAKRRTYSQRHEGVAPADGVDKIRKQMDRHQRQREAERRLQGEHRADPRRIGELCDRGRELR